MTQLTAKVIRDAMDAIRTAPQPTVCAGSDRHVVHPADYERGGLARCGGCLQVVYIPTPDERGDA